MIFLIEFDRAAHRILRFEHLTTPNVRWL